MSRIAVVGTVPTEASSTVVAARNLLNPAARRRGSDSDEAGRV